MPSPIDKISSDEQSKTEIDTAKTKSSSGVIAH